jgi:hypothetical protein
MGRVERSGASTPNTNSSDDDDLRLHE